MIEVNYVKQCHLDEDFTEIDTEYTLHITDEFRTEIVELQNFDHLKRMTEKRITKILYEEYYDEFGKDVLKEGFILNDCEVDVEHVRKYLGLNYDKDIDED